MNKKVKVGIVGCGAIGTGIALGIVKDLKDTCRLCGVYDINRAAAEQLAKKCSQVNLFKPSIAKLIKSCDCMVEAVSAKNTRPLIRQALEAKKDVLAMSVGKVFGASNLFRLARQNRCHLLFPSGAIAGVDAIKAASLAGIDSITLTTRKPPSGFAGNAYLAKRGIDPSKIRKETVLFDGDVNTATKHFPRNINVAATLALAARARKKLKVRILSSPRYKTNSHTIDVSGPFGRITTKTDNVVSPDNPKTSYLAVLSGLQTLRQYGSGVFIGT